MPGKALRLSPYRQRALRKLYQAGHRGEPVLTAPLPGLLVSYGLAEFFHDPTRVLTERVRLTLHGRHVAETLVLPKEA